MQLQEYVKFLNILPPPPQTTKIQGWSECERRTQELSFVSGRFADPYGRPGGSLCIR